MPGLSRRAVLKGVAAAAVAEKVTDGGFAPVSRPEPPVRPFPVLPPGAGRAEDFWVKCVGCGICMAACPERVLRPSVKLRHFGQPEMDFREGSCHYGCSFRCVKACPAGVLALPAGAGKRDVHLGHAIWKRDLCIRTTQEEDCTACVRKCPVKAITLVGGFPVVDRDACLGCGACEHVCPARPKPAIFVKGFEKQRIVRPISETDLVAEMRRVLSAKGCACVVAKDGVIVATPAGRGVAPALDLLSTRPRDLRGAIVLDRVVGRAAAAIFAKGGVRKVVAPVASRDAAALLGRHGVALEADETVEKILNRDRTGGCPLEARVAGTDDLDEMVKALK